MVGTLSSVVHIGTTLSPTPSHYLDVERGTLEQNVLVLMAGRA